MLKTLTLKNWQCHKDLTISFDRYVTVLVGDNGSGKSAILRAIKWACLNKWDGKANDFITWEESESQVSLTFGNHKLTRRKSQVSNLFLLDDQEYMPGTKVPNPIASILNVGQDNFQEHNDGTFWFFLTGSQIAGALNKIVNLDAIDRSLTRSAAIVREVQSELKFSEQRYTEVRNLTEKLSWVLKANQELETIGAKENELAQVSNGVNGLALCLRTLRHETAIARNAANAIQGLEVILSMTIELEGIEQKILLYKSTLTQIDDNERIICETEKELKEKEKRLETLLQVCPLCQRSDK